MEELEHGTHKWVVLVASLFTNLLDYGVMLTFGTLFVALLNTFSERRSTTAVVGSMFLAFGRIFAVFTGLLITRFGIKPVAFTGAFLVPAGFIISFWATSILYLDFSIGVVSGIGCAFIRVTGVVVAGRSFTGTQKTIALSIDSLGTAIAGLIYPQLNSFLLEEYNIRGTFLILGGLLLNSFVFAIIFSYADESNHATSHRDLSKDGKQNDAFEENDETINASVKDDSIHENTTTSRGGNSKMIDSKKENTLKNRTTQSKRIGDTIFGQEKEGHNRMSNENCDKQLAPEKDNHNVTVEPSTGKGVQKQNGRCHTCTVMEPSNENRTENQSGGLDEHQYNLCSLVFVMFLIGSCFVTACLASFVTLYQDILGSKDFTIFQSNIAYNCFSAFNFVSRLLPIVPSKFQNLNVFLVPFIAALSGGFSQLFLLFGTSYPIALLGMSLAGVCIGAMISSLQTIVFQIVKPTKQVVGFGLLLSSGGFLSTLSGPLFGSIRDSTQSYALVLIISCCIYLTSGLFFLVCIAKTGGMKCCHLPLCFDSKETVVCTKL